MIPNAADVAASLHASRRALRVAPWKIVLAYALVAVVWIFVTNLIITALGLPESSYTLRIALFVLFTALGIWWYTRRLADGVMRCRSWWAAPRTATACSSIGIPRRCGCSTSAP